MKNCISLLGKLNSWYSKMRSFQVLNRLSGWTNIEPYFPISDIHLFIPLDDEAIFRIGLFVVMSRNPESGINAALHVVPGLALGHRTDGLLQLPDVLALEALLHDLQQFVKKGLEGTSLRFKWTRQYSLVKILNSGGPIKLEEVFQGTIFLNC